MQTTGVHGPVRAEARGDSTVEDLGQGCSHARCCATTGAHGLDRVGNCRDSTDADRIRATHVRHGTRLGSSASWCGVCPARFRCRVNGSSTHRDVVSGKESQTQCAIILRRHPFQIEVCERNVLSESEYTERHHIRGVSLDGSDDQVRQEIVCCSASDGGRKECACSVNSEFTERHHIRGVSPDGSDDQVRQEIVC